MSDRWKTVDVYILAILLEAGLIFLPMLRPGIPNTADGLLHLYRSALWRWAWDEGVIWPQWHTLLYYGYGYPVFKFAPPIVYVIVSILAELLPNFIVAFKLFILLVCANYGISMYMWAREYLSRTGAFLAATAYLFATYRFRELFVQGNYPQFFAWSLFPWIMFSFMRLVWYDKHRYMVYASISYSILALTHNISLMLFTPFLVLYVFWIASVKRKWRTLFSGIISIILGFGIASGFWIPAMIESRMTMVHVLTRGFFDVANHFITLKEVFKPSPILDYRAANPPIPFNMGRTHILLTILGFASGACIWGKHILSCPKMNGCNRKSIILVPISDIRLFSAFSMIAGVFMMLPPSLQVWDLVPFIRFAEFPTRLYGEVFLFSSFLVGSSTVWFEWLDRDLNKSYISYLYGIVASLALIVSVAVYQFPRNFVVPDVTPKGFVRYERTFNAPGTTSASEYLTIPSYMAPKEPAISTSMHRRAFHRPPEGIEGKVTRCGAQFIEIKYYADKDEWVDIAQFYFSGWRAWVDENEVYIYRNHQNGLIRIYLPKGKHILMIRMTNSPIRHTAFGLSLLAIIVVIFIWVGSRNKTTNTRQIRVYNLRESPWGGYLMVGIILGMMGLRALWIEPRTHWFRMTSPPGAALPATHHASVAVGRFFSIIGYDVEPIITKQGENIFVRLYWQPHRRVFQDYSSFVHLVAGPQKTRFAGSDNLHPAYIPTSKWDPTYYVVDNHKIHLPDNIPPIAYKLVVGMYKREGMRRIGSGELPIVVHVLPRTPVKPKKTNTNQEIVFGDTIRLVGYEFQKQVTEYTLLLYWLPVRQPKKDWQVFVHLVDQEGNIVAYFDGPPVEGLYPTSLWLPGEVIVDKHVIELPNDADDRSLRSVKVGLYDLETLKRLPAKREDGEILPEYAVEIPFMPSQ